MSTWNTTTLWKYSMREMQRRPGRTILSLLGIIFGVAAVVAIPLTTAMTSQAYRQMFDSLAGRASLEVTAEGLSGFPQSLAQELDSIPNVTAVVPVIQLPTVLFGPAGSVGVLVFGVDPQVEHAARDYFLRLGRGLDEGEGVLLEAGFAEAQGVSVGQSIKLLSGLRTVQVPVLGLLEPRGAATFNGGAVAFMTIPLAQRLFGMAGQVNRLQLVLTEEKHRTTVAADVRGRLPAGYQVDPPAARGALAQDFLFSTELGLGALSVCSLVAGGFVILNSFLMSLGERRRQLAILRALGATRGQVTRLLVQEGLIFGLIGTLIGSVIGALWSVGLRKILEQMLGVVLPTTPWAIGPFVVALLLGPGMALAATYLPARLAARRAPLEDLLQKGGAHARLLHGWTGYVGLVLMSLALLIEAGIVTGWLPSDVAANLLPPGMGLTLVGLVLALPLFLKPLMRLAKLLMSPFMGLEGHLAFRHLERQPTRTALTVGVLFISLVVSIAYGQSVRNNLRDIYAWCEQNIGFDFIVRALMPDPTALVTATPLAEELREDIASMPGVDQVYMVGFLPARMQGRAALAICVTIVPDGDMPIALLHGDVPTARQAMLRGDVVLGTALATRLGVQLGDPVTLETRQGPVVVHVAGTTAEYTVGGMAFYLEYQHAKEWFHLRGPHAFTIRARRGMEEILAAPLAALCREHGLQCQNRGDFRRMVDQTIQGVIGFYWGLVILVYLVASLGIVNTLTMNVLEQTRELGILRAVAMTRGQIARMIVVQALALAMVSLVPGTLLGIGVAYLMNLASQPILGHEVPFELDPLYIAGCFLMALVITTVTAYLPARRAARLQVIQALQYE